MGFLRKEHYMKIIVLTEQFIRKKLYKHNSKIFFLDKLKGRFYGIII